MNMQRNRGFTLVELLVALSVMAILSVLSWRGLDGMMRSQSQTRQYSDALMVLQTALAQWRTDLDAMADARQVQPVLPAALDWSGLALRIARRSASPDEAGLHVVAWSRRDVQGVSQWLRWQSPVARTRAELQTAWQQAALWAQNPGPEQRQYEVVITPLLDWKIFYFRDSAWSNPLSSDASSATATPPGSAPPPSAPPSSPLRITPDGIRLVLTLPPGLALSGTLTSDWIRPSFGGGKS